MGIRGMGSTGKVRKPGNNAYLGLTVPKPVTAWKKAHAHARKEGLLTKRGDRLKDRGEWHITVMSPQELRSLKGKHPELETDAFELPLSGAKGARYAGVGRQQQGDKTVYFVIVNWPAAQEFRAKYGLPKYDFHVTIGFVGGDIFNVPKDKSTRISMERYAGLSREVISAPKSKEPAKKKAVIKRGDGDHDSTDKKVPYTNGPVAVVIEKGRYHVRLHTTSFTYGVDVVVEPTLEKAIKSADRIAKFPDRYRKAFKLL